MAKATTKAKTTTSRKATTKSASNAAAPKAPAKTTRKAAAKTAPKTVAKTAKAAPKKTTKAPAPLAAPSPVAEAAKVNPVVVQSQKPTVTGLELRKEQLLDEVSKRSGAKRKDVKPIVEAALEVIGEALGEGQDLNLKPIGKVKIARTKQVANGRVINVRVRQSDMVIKELEGTKEAAE